MKGWITAALLVTFLSGGTTGYLLGQRPEPLAPEDPYILQLRQHGVTESGIEQAKVILAEREKRIRDLKDKVLMLLSDQIGEINAEATERIQRIIDGK